MCETNENYMNQQNINNYTSQQSSSSHSGRYRVYWNLKKTKKIISGR